MFPYCTFKCGTEYCQNSSLNKVDNIEINIDEIVDRYTQNPITESIVMQGLEPFDSWIDLYEVVCKLRQYVKDDIVIYTGYRKDEIENHINELKKFENIIIKYGRYIPNEENHYDDILGVYLANDEQYAERIS
jgi:hypothetical protein